MPYQAHSPYSVQLTNSMLDHTSPHREDLDRDVPACDLGEPAFDLGDVIFGGGHMRPHDDVIGDSQRISLGYFQPSLPVLPRSTTGSCYSRSRIRQWINSSASSSSLSSGSGSDDFDRYFPSWRFHLLRKVDVAVSTTAYLRDELEASDGRGVLEFSGKFTGRVGNGVVGSSPTASASTAISSQRLAVSQKGKS